jgi:hypothetical protein
MRTVLLALAVCVACFAAPMAEVEVVVPPSAFHPQNWLRPELRENPKPDYRSKSVNSLGEFVAPEVISRIVVDQYAGPDTDVRRYLTAMPTAAVEYFGSSLELCPWRRNQPNRIPIYGAGLAWTSTSTVTFESGRRGRLTVATVVVSNSPKPPGVTPAKRFGFSEAPDCLGLDKVPVDSLYVSYIDPDGYTWAFAVPLRTKK